MHHCRPSALFCFFCAIILQINIKLLPWEGGGGGSDWLVGGIKLYNQRMSNMGRTATLRKLPGSELVAVPCEGANERVQKEWRSMDRNPPKTTFLRI